MQIEETGPAFATAMRGYDREQVDEYVSTVLAYADETQERAVRAEAALAELEAEREVLMTSPPTATAPTVTGTGEQALHELPERLGDAVRTLLADGRRVAEELVREARTDREAAAAALAEGRARATAEAAAAVSAAHAEAAGIVEAAHQEQASTLALTEEQVVALRQQADQQQARRDDVLRQLAALRTLLAGTAEEVTTVGSGETTATPAATLEAVAQALATPAAARAELSGGLDVTDGVPAADPDAAEAPAETTLLLLPRDVDARVP